MTHRWFFHWNLREFSSRVVSGQILGLNPIEVWWDFSRKKSHGFFHCCKLVIQTKNAREELSLCSLRVGFHDHSTTESTPWFGHLYAQPLWSITKPMDKSFHKNELEPCRPLRRLKNLWIKKRSRVKFNVGLDFANKATDNFHEQPLCISIYPCPDDFIPWNRWIYLKTG